MQSVATDVYMSIELKEKVSEAANQRDQSMSEFMRESARRELQRMKVDGDGE